MADRIPDPAPPAKRSDSLYERLKARGWPLLNEVMAMLGPEDEGARKRTRKTHRYLKAIGFNDQSESALTDMRHYCSDLWIYEKVRHEEEELPLPPDADEVGARKFRRTRILEKLKVANSMDLLVSEKMESERTKREVSLRGVAVREETLHLKIYESQEISAAEIEAIFADADKMAALAAARADMVGRGLSEAERVEAIRLRLYGEQAAVKPQPEAQAAA